MTQTDKWAWDRQWRGSLVSTCLLEGDSETGDAFVQGWGNFFSNLPKGAKILDIGTGNGFVPLIALEVSDRAGKKFEIHGADMAVIDPARALPDQAEQLSRISFHTEAPSENLPFEDETFGAITGQHALEYADLNKAVPEIARILKPSGAVRFLVHAADGDIVKSNLPKIEQCRYLLEEIDLFSIAERAVEDALKGQGDQGAVLKEALKNAADQFKGDANIKDLMELLNLLRGAFEQRNHFPDLATFKNWLSENKRETEAQMIRIIAMKEAALNEASANVLAKSFQGEGFENVRLEPLYAGANQLIGRVLEVKKKLDKI